LAHRAIFLGLSSENSHFNNLAGLNGLQRGERLGNMRPNVIEIIRRRTDNQNSDISASDVLLMPDVLIYGDRSEGHLDGRETSWQALPPLTILTWIFLL
jgi:hypothetical protein